MTLSLKEAARLNGRIIYLELLVLALSLYSLGALTADLLLTLDPATHHGHRFFDDGDHCHSGHGARSDRRR